MALDELFHWHIVQHGEREHLLQDEIEVVPVDVLFLVQQLEVHVDHLVDLEGGENMASHHLLVRLSLPLILLLFLLTARVSRQGILFIFINNIITFRT